jgi:hypothetical protein
LSPLPHLQSHYELFSFSSFLLFKEAIALKPWHIHPLSLPYEMWRMEEQKPFDFPGLYKALKAQGFEESRVM